MGDILSLRLARKRAVRQRKDQSAAAQRLLHGQSKRERALTAAQRGKAQDQLEQHRLGNGECDEIAGGETLDRDRQP
jgi:hypothetical protein